MTGANPTVTTLNGQIKGKIYKTVFDREILAFHRIPYMKAPIGKLRFKDPQPVDNWTTVLDCSLDPIPSLNKNFRCAMKIEGDESALHINAYTKNLTPDKLRPVMIWIHGGGFISDSSSTSYYAPDFLLEKDIVLFTFNYRLSVLGFLSLDEPKLGVPGNAGLKDQCMALQWIKKNCAQFGGDPNNITIFGESAGSASVHYHCVSEMSRGLFHKAILMSGTILAPWASISVRGLALRLAKVLGWQDDDPHEKALDILQNVSGELLLNSLDNIITPAERVHFYHPFMPIVEPYVSEQCFISKPLVEMMIDPWTKDMPMIVSTTSFEGYILITITNFKENSTFFDHLGNFEHVVPKTVAANSAKRKKEFGQRIKNFYFGDKEPSIENYQPYIDLVSDSWFIHPTQRMLKTRTINPEVPTYLLRFDFDSPGFNHFKSRIFQLENEKGAAHADDLSYLFKNEYYDVTGGLPPGSREYKTMERMVGIFTNFATHSDPNGTETDGIVWKPLNSKHYTYKCLNITDNVDYVDWPESERMKLWDQIYADDLVP